VILTNEYNLRCKHCFGEALMSLMKLYLQEILRKNAQRYIEEAKKSMKEGL